MPRSAVVLLCLVAYAGCVCAVTTNGASSASLVEQPKHMGATSPSLWQGLRKLLQTATSSTTAQASFGNRKSGCAATADANAGFNGGVATADTTAQAFCWGKAARKQEREAEKQKEEWEREERKRLERQQKEVERQQREARKRQEEWERQQKKLQRQQRKAGNNWGFGKGGNGNGKGRKFL